MQSRTTIHSDAKRNLYGASLAGRYWPVGKKNGDFEPSLNCQRVGSKFEPRLHHCLVFNPEKLTT